MGKSAVRFKVMPKSLDIDLKELKPQITEIIESFDGVVSEITEEPIAFGLKALIITFALDESREVDEVENEITCLKGVSSTELIDYRRAVG